MSEQELEQLKAEVAQWREKNRGSHGRKQKVVKLKRLRAARREERLARKAEALKARTVEHVPSRVKRAVRRYRVVHAEAEANDVR